MELLDRKTGEIVEVVPVWNRAKEYYNKPHVTMFQDALKLIACSDLSKDEHKVFMFLMAEAGMGNEIIFSFTDAAKALNLLPTNFTRALNGLVKRNIVVKGPKIGRTPSLRINYTVAWKGKIKDYNLVKVEDIPVTLSDN